MDILITIFYFVLVLSILVVVHEFGHFITAKMFGIRAEVFSVGMGTRLFGYHRKTGFTFGNLPPDYDYGDYTDYRLALLPIGGYVKIAGMIDESMDKDFLDKPSQPWEFRSKKGWQKFIVLIAGVTMNFLLAVLIFAIISFVNGASLVKTTQVGWVAPNSIAEKIGFQKNDKILEINGKQMQSWNEILENLTLEDLGKQKTIKVERAGNTIILSASGKEILRNLADKKALGLEPPGQRVFFQNVETIKPAGIAGLKKGDTVVVINGETVSGVIQFTSTIKSHKEKPLILTIKRNNELIDITVTPNSDGIIGVMLGSIYQGPIEHVKYNVFQSIGLGFTQSIDAIGLFFGSIAQIFNGTLTVKESVGGPIMIAQQASQQASMGLMSFLNFIALLSVSLAIINILPLPALDGGHLIFVLIESITRKEVSPKIKIAVQQSGVVLLMILMIFVIYNDLTR